MKGADQDHSPSNNSILSDNSMEGGVDQAAQELPSLNNSDLSSDLSDVGIKRAAKDTRQNATKSHRMTTPTTTNSTRTDRTNVEMNHIPGQKTVFKDIPVFSTNSHSNRTERNAGDLPSSTNIDHSSKDARKNAKHSLNMNCQNLEPSTKNSTRTDRLDVEKSRIPGRVQNTVSNDHRVFSTTSNSNQNEKTTGDLRNGKHLETEVLVKLLRTARVGMDSIPQGIKEDKYFIINNERNTNKINNNKHRDFSDDCGAWVSKKGSSPLVPYFICEDGSLKRIFKVKDKGYCHEKYINKTRHTIPLDPQPTSENLIIIHRYYATLEEDENYKKRVSSLADGGVKGLSDVSIVEYVGSYPGLGQHGNQRKTGNKYVRTPGDVIDTMSDLLKQNLKPQQVYNQLLQKNDEMRAPNKPRQVHDKKRRDEKKEEKEKNGVTYHRNNIADHIAQLQSRVASNDPFVRFVGHSSGKTPSIILFSDEQIRDVKNLCCNGQTVLGFDKTFNLCNMHVTVSCFKQLSVVRHSTGEPPLFLGPAFIHDNSDMTTYSMFFSHLKTHLMDVNTENLVIGTDDEAALKKAISLAFSSSNHVLCTRHLQENTIQKLKDDTVDKSERKQIVDRLFGTAGLINANDSICFEEQCEDFKAFCHSRAPRFLNYFEKRLQCLLLEKVNQPQRLGRIEKKWTNNNCESINHVLKQTINWKSQPLTEFIESMQGLVDSQYKDLRRALFGAGQYRLADSHAQFQLTRTEWAAKTTVERYKLFTRFRKYVEKDRRLVTASDGRTKVVGPRTMGKKIGQTKRKITERTTTIKKQKTTKKR